MKIIEIDGKQVVFTDEQVAAAKILAVPFLNILLAMGAILITPNHPRYKELKNLLDKGESSK